MSSSCNCALPPDIIAFGNVLLDMTVEISNTDILEKYGLSLDVQGEISTEKLSQIAEEVKSRFEVSYNPGGSALNSCRILRKLDSVKAIFFGAVGNDECAEILRRTLCEKEVPVSFQVVPNVSTGKCVCFVHGDKTALYANIGASGKFSKEYLQEETTHLNSLVNPEKEQIFYIEGFFLPKRSEACQFIIKTYISGNKKLAINLNAPYIVRENFKEITFMVEWSTFVFGNKKEFTTLANLSGFDSLEELAQDLLSRRKKILVCTNGSEKVCVHTNLSSKYNYEEFPAKKVSEQDIVDTTGAGDSFVAGFLNAFLNKKPIADCVAGGCDIASKVVTQVGCNLP